MSEQQEIINIDRLTKSVDNLDKENTQKEGIFINSLKQMIEDEKISMHSPNRLFRKTIPLVEKSKNDAQFKPYEIQELNELLDRIKLYFEKDIWSRWKLDKNGKKFIFGYGMHIQSYYAEVAYRIADRMLDTFIIGERKSIDELKYESLLKDVKFNEYMEKIQVRNHIVTENEVKRFLASFRMRRLFQWCLHKVKASTLQIPVTIKGCDDFHKSIKAEQNKITEVLFGLNLISSSPPTELKWFLAEEGKILKAWGEIDIASILFKTPTKKISNIRFWGIF